MSCIWYNRRLKHSLISSVLKCKNKQNAFVSYYLHYYSLKITKYVFVLSAFVLIQMKSLFTPLKITQPTLEEYLKNTWSHLKHDYLVSTLMNGDELLIRSVKDFILRAENHLYHRNDTTDQSQSSIPDE